MLILVHELEEPLQIDHEFKPEALKFSHEGAQLRAPVHLRASVTRSGEDVQIDGTFSTVLELTCSRCLKVFTLPLNHSLDLFYEPVKSPEGSGALSYNDMDVSYYQGDVIDVRQMLTEQIELLVPMKTICSETCKGLCGVCGADLNMETCRCAPAVTDERLQPLEQLKKRLKSN